LPTAAEALRDRALWQGDPDGLRGRKSPPKKSAEKRRGTSEPGVMTTTISKARSLALVTVAYIIAIGVAAAWLVWGAATGRLWLDTFIADILVEDFVAPCYGTHHIGDYFRERAVEMRTASA